MELYVVNSEKPYTSLQPFYRSTPAHDVVYAVSSPRVSMILGLNPYPVSIHSFILSQQHTQKQSWYEGLLMQELVGLVFFCWGGGQRLMILIKVDCCLCSS